MILFVDYAILVAKTAQIMGTICVYRAIQLAFLKNKLVRKFVHHVIFIVKNVSVNQIKIAISVCQDFNIWNRTLVLTVNLNA